MVSGSGPILCCVSVLAPLWLSFLPLTQLDSISHLLHIYYAIASIDASSHMFCIFSDHYLHALLTSCCCSWPVYSRPAPSNTRTTVPKPSMTPHDLAQPQMPISPSTNVVPNLPKQMAKDWKRQLHPVSCRSKVLTLGAWHSGTKFTNII